MLPLREANPDVVTIERAAFNQALARVINERVLALHATLQPSVPGRGAFVCECFDTGCAEPVYLTPDEYEAVRADGNLFLVLASPAHVAPDVETVVERFDRYWTVKMLDLGAEIVTQLDPRQAG